MNLSIASALGLLFSINANANPLKGPPEVEPPIRTAKLTGEVIKYTSAGRGQKPKSEPVCKVDADIPVHAPWIAGQSKARSLAVAVDCEAAIEEENLTFSILSEMSLTEAKNGKPEGKDLTLFIPIYKDKNRGQILRAETFHVNGDRDAKRLGAGFTIPQTDWDTKEYLSLSLEVEDSNQ